jgi:formylmethanofuran dehydrogenase subunit C
VYLNNWAITIADSDGLENQGTIYYSTGSGSDISQTDTDSGTAVYNTTRTIRDYGAEDYYNLRIDGGAVSVTLTADLKVNGNLSFLNGGTLNLSGYTLTVDGDVSGTGTLNVADGTLIVNGDVTVSSLTATSGTIQAGGSFNTSFAPGTSTVEFIDSSKPSKIFGSNTFNNLSIITPNKTMLFDNTATQTVSSLTVTGTESNEVQLLSDDAGLSWDISAALASVHYA